MPTDRPLWVHETVPQVDCTMNGDDEHDDNDSFCRVPASAAHEQPKMYRLPTKQSGVSTPTRRNCTTSSTMLTLESAPIPSSSYESDDEYYSPSSRVDPEDCWGSLVLQSLFSLISPKKKNAISCNESIDPRSSRVAVTDDSDDTPVKKSANAQEFQFDSLSDTSEKSWASPNGVEDFPLSSSSSESALSSKRLHYNHLGPPLIEDQQQQDDSEDLAQEFPLPSESNLPSKRLHCHHLQPPFAEQDDSGVLSEAPHHFLDAASKYEAESNLNAAISCLEQFLYQSQFLTTSFECEHSKASALHKLGILQWKCGRYFFSEHVLLDCLHIYQSLLDRNNNSAKRETEVHSQLALETAHVLVSTGRVYLSKGEGDAAMECYNECIRHLSSIPRSKCNSVPITPARIFAQACVGAGRVLASQGRSKASLKRYKRALKIQLGHQVADSPSTRGEIHALSVHEARVPLIDIAETLSHLGRLYEQCNNFARAMECHTRALAFYRSVLDPNAVDIGYASNNLGQLYLRIGRVAEAEEAFKTAHQVFSLRLGKNHRNTADALLSIGQLYASQGLHNKALSTFKRVLRSKPAVFGELLAATFHSIACSYDATFRLDKALKYYQREVNVLIGTLSPYHVSVARILHHMAKIAIQSVDCKGEYMYLDQTVNWLEEAAEIYHNNKGKVYNHELLHLESSLEETRKRIKREHRSL
mmetsp:Transcript_18072/g.39051  ORF Transcript_18072/g.39051 Transcript_18072/m.39051 type:complete len:701 (-) Transcript_18072:54-2156(-)|eukprot:CAMPEP_0172320478 /NCGR_PEP_ID=MMETSP1058-20130122/40655_1 /TAXON_ID=83371 /ORGANISM="Detonula confervacea, Strain CCMP 353" /LENGTH=700 /DNA_ID=CAMNT_0013035757 /DNA_START=118 /DNA_END=2220 /DNA_ORIENTATION=-